MRCIKITARDFISFALVLSAFIFIAIVHHKEGHTSPTKVQLENQRHSSRKKRSRTSATTIASTTRESSPFRKNGSLHRYSEESSSMFNTDDLTQLTASEERYYSRIIARYNESDAVRLLKLFRNRHWKRHHTQASYSSAERGNYSTDSSSSSSSRGSGYNKNKYSNSSSKSAYTKYLESRSQIAGFFRLDNDTMASLHDAGTKFVEARAPYVLLTAGSWTYRGAVFNWIKHTEARGIKNYLVLCFDEQLYRYVGPVHGIYVRNSAAVNYTIGEKMSTAYALEKTTTQKKKNTQSDVVTGEANSSFVLGGQTEDVSDVFKTMSSIKTAPSEDKSPIIVSSSTSSISSGISSNSGNNSRRALLRQSSWEYITDRVKTVWGNRTATATAINTVDSSTSPSSSSYPSLASSSQQQQQQQQQQQSVAVDNNRMLINQQEQPGSSNNRLRRRQQTGGDGDDGNANSKQTQQQKQKKKVEGGEETGSQRQKNTRETSTMIRKDLERRQRRNKKNKKNKRKIGKQRSKRRPSADDEVRDDDTIIRPPTATTNEEERHSSSSSSSSHMSYNDRIAMLRSNSQSNRKQWQRRNNPTTTSTAGGSSLSSSYDVENDKEEEEEKEEEDVKPDSSSSSRKEKQEKKTKKTRKSKMNKSDPNAPTIVKGVLASRINDFHIMMIAKYEAINAFLQFNLSVIWSDSDNLIVNDCAISYLLHARSDIDIIGQRGLSPFNVAKSAGSCLCTGYFMVRPTARSLMFIEAMRQELVDSLARAKGKRGDQTPANQLLYRWRALRFRSSTTSGSAEEGSVAVAVTRSVTTKADDVITHSKPMTGIRFRSLVDQQLPQQQDQQPQEEEQIDGKGRRRSRSVLPRDPDEVESFFFNQLAAATTDATAKASSSGGSSIVQKGRQLLLSSQEKTAREKTGDEDKHEEEDDGENEAATATVLQRDNSRRPYNNKKLSNRNDRRRSKTRRHHVNDDDDRTAAAAAGSISGTDHIKKKQRGGRRSRKEPYLVHRYNMSSLTRYGGGRHRQPRSPSTNYRTDRVIEFTQEPGAKVIVGLLPYYQFPRGIPPNAVQSLWYSAPAPVKTDDRRTFFGQDRRKFFRGESPKPERRTFSSSDSMTSFDPVVTKKLSSVYDSMSVTYASRNTSTDTRLNITEKASSLTANLELDKVAEELLHEEWRLLSPTACIWHRISAKEGGSKVSAMARDGVLLLSEAWLNSDLTVDEVQAVLYGNNNT